MESKEEEMTSIQITENVRLLANIETRNSDKDSWDSRILYVCGLHKHTGNSGDSETDGDFGQILVKVKEDCG